MRSKVKAALGKAGTLPAFDYIREQARKPPAGHRRVSDAKSVKKLSPLIGAIASGQVPLDEEGAQVVGHVLSHAHRRSKRLMKGGQ